MFEESAKFTLPITDHPDNTATLQTTNIEVPANTKPMLHYICDDEDASTSTDKNFMIDVPDIL